MFKINKEESKYFQDAHFYSVPLSNMWDKLTNISQTVVVLFLIIYYNLLYWGNKSTKKLTGLQISYYQKLSKKEIS